MMGLHLLDDRRDRRISLDHGCVHFLVKSFEFRLLLVGGRRTRFVCCLHGLVDGLFFRTEARIGGNGGIVGLFPFGLLVRSQKSAAVVFAGRRTIWRRCVGRLCVYRAGDNCPQREEKKDSFHYLNDTGTGESVSHYFTPRRLAPVRVSTNLESEP